MSVYMCIPRALHVKNGEDEWKVYICLFTCASTKAAHLEIAQDIRVESEFHTSI